MLYITTPYFVSLSRARRAYGDETQSALAEGRIIIGKPENLPEGATLKINEAGQYVICEKESTK